MSQVLKVKSEESIYNFFKREYPVKKQNYSVGEIGFVLEVVATVKKESNEQQRGLR